METFKFENGDLAIDGAGNVVMVEGDDEIAQSVEMILTANKGEWFLDEEFGLDYSEITDKSKTEKDIRFALREAIYQEERIAEVEFTSLIIDHNKRTLDVRLRLTKVDGRVLGVGVSI